MTLGQERAVDSKCTLRKHYTVYSPVVRCANPRRVVTFSFTITTTTYHIQNYVIEGKGIILVSINDLIYKLGLTEERMIS